MSLCQEVVEGRRAGREDGEVAVSGMVVLVGEDRGAEADRIIVRGRKSRLRRFRVRVIRSVLM